MNGIKLGKVVYETIGFKIINPIPVNKLDVRRWTKKQIKEFLKGLHKLEKEYWKKRGIE